jgi:hypothetical protein
MGKVNASPDISNVEDLEQVKRFTSICLKQIVDNINGNLRFQDNFKAVIVDVSFSAADTSTQFGHSLGITPTGYILIQSSAAMVLYDGSSGNTESLVYLRSSATGSGKILLFYRGLKMGLFDGATKSLLPQKVASAMNQGGGGGPSGPSELQAQANEMYNQARTLRTGAGQRAQDSYNMASDQARRGLAQQMAGIKQGASSRGLGYSGLRQAAEASAYGGLTSGLAGQRSAINKQVEDEAFGAETDAMAGLQSAREADIAQAQDAYQAAMAKKQLKAQGDSRFFGLAGLF